MLFPRAALGVLTLTACGLAHEMAVDAVKDAELYKSGKMHEMIMAKKYSTFDRQKAAGAYKSEQYPELGFVPCKDGLAIAIKGDANNTFRCDNVDLYHFLSHSALGSTTGEGSSSWGWTSDDGREFIAFGQADAAAFIEILPEGKMSYLGRLPTYSVNAIWREIRAYKHYMVIGSEAKGHNIQIFDMKKLLNIDPKNPVTFDKEKDCTGIFKGLPSGRSHTVSINEATGFAYANGAAPRTSACKAGLIAIDLSDPSNPTSPGCASEDGYVHDAQCVVYKGPDTQYNGREICYGYNEDSLTIYDMTDKKAPTILSRTSYQGASYTHQGWLLDTTYQEYLLMDDEYDEFDRAEPAADGHPVTYIWNIANLTAPVQTGYYKSSAYSIDHNQYIKDGVSYQSNYGAGLRIYDVSSIPRDPTGGSVKELGFFDVYPEDDGEPNGGVIDFVGSWSSYAFLKEFVFVNTIERGAFLVKRTNGEGGNGSKKG
ncbi:hypothetical protein BU16DRAFT_108595 [Lophium mytilinum]|uniref:Regulatory P domain-containing protein n=1 Tax=Lophium mytilinum TaxID=390894 RepID=A0A6A6QMY2_9PEZI|nr:hypothetical protein BU16DRAFT_108595 [Lophium mytilinum]